MRPHTRTQCQENGTSHCLECCQPANNTGTANALSSGTVALRDANQNSNDNNIGNGISNGSTRNGDPSDPDSLLFAVPFNFMSSRTGSSTNFVSRTFSSNMSSVSNAPCPDRDILLVELPAEVLVKILGYLSFKTISEIRMVSRRFNELCASILNTTFQKLQTQMLDRFQMIKVKMPRRESARRNHPLAKECNIVETIEMRLSLLQMTLGKHIERKHVCFFAGEILDEVYRILSNVRNITSSRVNSFMTDDCDELCDLCTMAMEYFKEHIEPTLPDITYCGAEYLNYDVPFPSPSKKRVQSGMMSGSAVESASAVSLVSMSSWASSNCSSNASGKDFLFDEDCNGYCSGNSLKRKFAKLRQGMKRQNNQLLEMKKEVKACKNKIESQTRLISEYARKLDNYDSKFEEAATKFQTMLTELNKCRTELQVLRSKPGADLSEADSLSEGEQGQDVDEPSSTSAPVRPPSRHELNISVLEDNAASGHNQHLTRSALAAMESSCHGQYSNSTSDGSQKTPISPRPLTRSGPPSPVPGMMMNNSLAPLTPSSRKRVANKPVEEIENSKRKSLRGKGVKNRAAKRQKV